MASVAFNFNNSTNGGANEQSTTNIVAVAGDKLRIRFEERGGAIGLFLHITSNLTETKEPISGSATLLADGFSAGDIVKISCQLNGNQFSSAKGIVEFIQ